MASLMLGYPSNVNREMMLGIYGERRPEYAAYFQDDIKLTPRLTVNLGIRWDLFDPFVEHHDRQSNFDETTGKFVPASPDASIGGQRFGRKLQVTPHKDFAPRVGFAYNVFGTGKTILRGGSATACRRPRHSI